MLFTGPPLTTFERIALPACSVLMLAAVGTLVVGMQTKRPALLKIAGVLTVAVVVLTLLLSRPPRRDTFADTATEPVTAPNVQPEVQPVSLWQPEHDSLALCFSRDGRTLFVGGTGGITVYRVQGAQLTAVHRQETDAGKQVMALVLSNNGKMLLAMTGGNVILFNAASLAAGLKRPIIASTKRFGGPVTNYRRLFLGAFSPDDKLLLVGDMETRYIIGLSVPKLKPLFAIRPLNIGALSMLGVDPFDKDRIWAGTMATEFDSAETGVETCTPGTIFNLKLSEWSKKAVVKTYVSFDTGCTPISMAGLNDRIFVALSSSKKVRAYAAGGGATTLGELDFDGVPYVVKTTSASVLVMSVTATFEPNDMGGRLDVINPATLERVATYAVGSGAADLAVSGDLAVVSDDKTLACVSLSGLQTYQINGVTELKTFVKDDGKVAYNQPAEQPAAEQPAEPAATKKM